MSIILASKSPRRKELLELMGLEFSVLTADVDETMNAVYDIEDEIKKVSLKKATAVMEKVTAEDIIISADTVVICDSEIMGKPKSKSDAVKMLTKLSGRTHKVITGVTVAKGESILSETVVTKVTFRDINDTEIKSYVDTLEPMDKAGAYGIQGKAAVFVSSIEGDYYNVVGLPVCKLSLMLKKFL